MAINGPDPNAVAELLGKPAGAAPDAPKPEGAAPVVPGKDTKPPEGFVPIAAVQGEQENTRKAREESARYRATLEAYGVSFDEAGNPLPITREPAPPVSHPTVSPKTQQLAERLGIEPQEFQDALDERVMQTGGVLLDPISRANLEQFERFNATDDPDYPIYAKSFRDEVDRRVKTLPSHLQAAGRNHPELLADARSAAKTKHWNELTAKAVERKIAETSGRVVGRKFVEGAAPGSSEGPEPRPFSDETREKLRQWGMTPEEIAKREAARGPR